MKYEPNIPDFKSMFNTEEISRHFEEDMDKIEPIEYENSILKEQTEDISERVSEKLERQIAAIENIANFASEIASSAKEQAESAKTIAEKADTKSTSADKKSNKSFWVSVLALIATLAINADRIWHNLQSLLSYLHRLLGLE